MSSARYIGRVGALAVALGIGAAVANSPGVAYAEPDSTSNSEATSESSGPTGSASTSSADSSAATEPAPDSSGDSPFDPPAGSPPETSVSSSGGPHTSTHGGGTDGLSDDADGTSAETSVSSSGGPHTSTHGGGTDGLSDDADGTSAETHGDTPVAKNEGSNDRRTTAPETSRAEAVSSGSNGGAARRAVATTVERGADTAEPTARPAAMPTAVTAAPASSTAVVARAQLQPIAAPAARTAPVRDVVTGFASGLLGSLGLAPMTTPGPVVPPESPVPWAMFAWARKAEQESSFVAASSRIADTSSGDVTTSLALQEGPMAMAAAVAANSAPVAGTPTVGTPDLTTGKVTGSLNVTDPDGNPLSYSVTGAPSSGAVALDGAGGFTYTPTQAARLRAGQTAGADADAFTVAVSDGVASTSVLVKVTVFPAAFSAPVSWATGSGSNPAGVVVVSGKGVYVANTGKNTVSLLDPVSGAVVKTIAVGGSPTAMLASSDGASLWVANAGSNTVMRINTTTNAVVATTQVGRTPRALALNGSTLWVANAGSDTVSRISTVTNLVVGSQIRVGRTPYGITVSRDGSQVYVTNRDGNSVTRISTTTNAVLGTITDIGPGPVAVAATAGRAYTVNYNGNYVAVFDTVTNEGVNMIPVGVNATSMALSPDSSALLYVTNANDTVSVIDLRSESVISTITVAPTGPSGTHSVAVSPDGTKLYVTDGADGTVRVLTLVRGNTVPQTALTVGTPDWTTGIVTGSINATDADGDALTYTVTQNPANGSTVSLTPTGGFTYTASASARQLAAQTPGLDDSFVVRVNDAGGGSTTATVTVTVAPPTQAGVTPIATGAYPSRVVVSNGKVYVLNYSAQTVSIINPATNQVVKTINVGAAPTAGPATALAVRADGRIYVAHFDSVQVLDTNLNQIVATVGIDDQCAINGCWGSAGAVNVVTINPSGTLVYAIRMYYTDLGPTSSVSVIDTATNAVIFENAAAYLLDLEWTPDGTRHYSAEGDYHFVPWSNINYTSGVVNVSAPGEWPYASNVAISPDGRRTYAVMHAVSWNPQPAVSIAVIDTDPTSTATYNMQIATIALPGAQDVAFSTDSTKAYVTMNDGKTITVINTATNAVIGSFTTDQNPSGGNRTVAVFGNTLYVTDDGDNTIYAVNLSTVPITAV